MSNTEKHPLPPPPHTHTPELLPIYFPLGVTFTGVVHQLAHHRHLGATSRGRQSEGDKYISAADTCVVTLMDLSLVNIGQNIGQVVMFGEAGDWG